MGRGLLLSWGVRPRHLPARGSTDAVLRSVMSSLKREQRLRRGDRVVLIIFALLAGEHAFGIWGALLALPTASVILSAFRWFREQVLKEPPSAHEGHGAWMRRLLAKWKGRAGSAAPGGST